MAFCVFLGLKNTPLSLFAAVSHAQLNIFHRVVGYVAVFLLLVHAITYTVHFGRQGYWERFVMIENIEGMGAGLAMLVLLMGIFRHGHYEVFYTSHIVGFLAAVVLTALHRPNWAKKLPLVMLIIFCMWAIDRLIRTARICYNLVNNSATFYPLPDGGTRILLKKPGAEAALPGSYCLLWIPKIRPCESHPFTIVNNGPFGLELIMKSHQGFTKAVGDFATRHPLSSAWASIDGPYGSLPETDKYDKLVFIAGGSGAAFTFGVMNRLMEHSERLRHQSCEFIWAVRRKGASSVNTHFRITPSDLVFLEHLSWFRDHLHNLTKAGIDLSLTIYVTNEPWPSPNSTIRAACETEATSPCVETRLLSTEEACRYGTISGVGDMDRLLGEAACDIAQQNPKIRFEKMAIHSVLNEALVNVVFHQRVLIATCGPKSLMDDVGDFADRWQNKADASVDVHCEDFTD
ncbi:hypothetical protein F66182_6063 [Fusarium sp. NRRL 66182]|nr:hypothetical protein F66182_6063 [Fusarium sp. NRRL 66182]